VVIEVMPFISDRGSLNLTYTDLDAKAGVLVPARFDGVVSSAMIPPVLPTTDRPVREWKAVKKWPVWHPKRWGFVTTFGSFKLFTQTLIVVSFVVGIALLVVVWRIDLSSQWFHGHAYIPNICAALTGFLIGAPVALVILATFQAEREQNEILVRVNRLSQLAWDNFVSSAQRFCTPERMKAVGTDAYAVDKLHKDAFHAVQSYVLAIRGGQPQNPNAQDDAIEAINKSHPPFETAVSGITHVLRNPETLSVEWSALVGAWNTLDQYVRLQRLERNLAWFDPEIDAELRKWLSRPQSPLGVFAELHGFGINQKSTDNTMASAAMAVSVYTKLDRDALRRALQRNSSKFCDVMEVRDYLAYAKEASFFLSRLRNCVNKVISADWPASEKVPQDDS
jgi:uncharacterized protein YutE (UPF0331/DUF86 family)